ncbi:protein-export chaperone SecB [Rhodobacteraceae bacterium NNCM2]|nr:protein-export chaperone SecB [Coraliihabitans acroporae]
MTSDTKSDEENGAGSETPEIAPGAEAATTQIAPTVKMLAHFTRDLSFENVGARENTGTGAEQPQISVNVGMDAQSLGENRYQIIMKINGTAKVAENTRFLIELEYGGVFQIDNAQEAHVHPILFIECPRQLLPFARRVVADVTRDGGYPPLMLDNVDFAALYRQKIEQLRAQQAEQAGSAGNETLN